MRTLLTVAVVLVAIATCTAAFAWPYSSTGTDTNFVTMTGPAQPLVQRGIVGAPGNNGIYNAVMATADVEAWSEESMIINNAKFHVGLSDEVVPFAVFEGFCRANVNGYLSIVGKGPDNDPCPLNVLTGYAGQAIGRTIDCDWQWKWGNGEYADMDLSDDFVTADGHAFGSNPINSSFFIKLTIDPDELQAEGQYILDPVIVFTPTI